jgi:hypothetical protein
MKKLFAELFTREKDDSSAVETALGHADEDARGEREDLHISMLQDNPRVETAQQRTASCTYIHQDNIYQRRGNESKRKFIFLKGKYPKNGITFCRSSNRSARDKSDEGNRAPEELLGIYTHGRDRTLSSTTLDRYSEEFLNSTHMASVSAFRATNLEKALGTPAKFLQERIFLRGKSQTQTGSRRHNTTSKRNQKDIDRTGGAVGVHSHLLPGIRIDLHLYVKVSYQQKPYRNSHAYRGADVTPSPSNSRNGTRGSRARPERTRVARIAISEAFEEAR